MKVVVALLITAVLPWSATAADTGSWQNLASLRSGERIEVATPAWTSKGEFVRFDAQSLTVRDKQGEHSIAQAEVRRVALPKRNRGLWIGAISGGAGGAIAGGALGVRLANESGVISPTLSP